MQKKREKKKDTKNIKRTWYTLGMFHNKKSKSQVIQDQVWRIKARESHQTSVFLVPHQKMCRPSWNPSSWEANMRGLSLIWSQATPHSLYNLKTKTNRKISQAWWYRLTVPTLRRWNQQGQEFQGLGYLGPCHKQRCKGRGFTFFPIEYRANWHSGLYLLYARAVNYFCQDKNKAERRCAP